MGDPEAARRLAAAAIMCAVKDARGRKGGDRVEAIAWLASKDATRYLDVLDMPQSTLLSRCGWMEWAYETIMNPPQTTTIEQINVIWASLAYLQDLRRSQHAEEGPCV